MINFSDCDSIDNLIELERVFVLSTLDIQKNLNKQILIFMKTFISNIKVSSDISPYKDVSIFLNEANSNLNKSDSNITSLNKLLNLLEKTQNSENSSNDFIKDYNEKFWQNKKCAAIKATHRKMHHSDCCDTISNTHQFSIRK